MEYFLHHFPQIAHQVLDHVWISFLALGLAACIGIPAGYLASRSIRQERWILPVFQILRVIPSLAVLVLLIPFLGTGIRPAVIALVILACPPILLNTIVGFREVPFFMIESARGMGMEEKDVFWKVRLPLARPMILSGLRTAMIEVIASATLAAKIGAGGLGEIIFTGLGLNRGDLLIIGGGLVALLSLTSGFIFDRIRKRILRYQSI